MSRVDLDGFAELEKKLALLGDPKTADRIGVEVGGKIMRKVVLPAIKEALPVGRQSTRRTRRLKSGEQVTADYGRVTTNIKVKKIRKPAGRQTLLWTVSTNQAFWWWMNEFGTVNQPANPVIRVTWERVAPDLPVAIGNGLWASLARVAGRRGVGIGDSPFGPPDATRRST